MTTNGIKPGMNDLSAFPTMATTDEIPSLPANPPNVAPGRHVPWHLGIRANAVPECAGAFGYVVDVGTLAEPAPKRLRIGGCTAFSSVDLLNSSCDEDATRAFLRVTEQGSMPLQLRHVLARLSPIWATIKSVPACSDLQTRIEFMLSVRELSLRTAGLNAGLSASLLSTYLRRARADAKADIGYLSLVAIAEASRVALAWLTAGVGPFDALAEPPPATESVTVGEFIDHTLRKWPKALR